MSAEQGAEKGQHRQECLCHRVGKLFMLRVAVFGEDFAFFRICLDVGSRIRRRANKVKEANQ